MVFKRSNHAFTLFELIVVIALIGVIAAFILPRAARWLGQAGKAEVTLKFAAIKEALNEYKYELGVFPTTREGLRALITNPKPGDERYRRSDRWPYLKEDQLSYKGNDFMYRCPPEKFKGKYKYYELIYLGPTQSEDDPDRTDDGV